MSEAEKDAFSAIKETKAPLHAQAAYTEQDLRQRLIDEGCSCDPLHTANQCGFHSALFAYEARIRSESRAGMREACAKACVAAENSDCEECNSGCHDADAAAIRKLPDLAADEAIERIKREAVLIELKRLEFHVHTFESGVQPWTKVDSRCEACKRIAALSGKEPSQ